MSTTTAATVLAKIAGLSTAGKATLGLAVAAGAVGVATAVPAIADPPDASGALVPAVSATADPTDDPTTDPTAEPTEEPTAGPTTGPTTEPTTEPTEDPGTAPTDLPSASAFGQAVAEDARDGGVVGPEIAALAHERNEERAQARDAVPTPEEPDGSETEPDAPDAQP